jgi:hypothetical protein
MVVHVKGTFIYYVPIQIIWIFNNPDQNSAILIRINQTLIKKKEKTFFEGGMGSISYKYSKLYYSRSFGRIGY